jgi:hypothetical protein
MRNNDDEHRGDLLTKARRDDTDEDQSCDTSHNNDQHENENDDASIASSTNVNHSFVVVTNEKNSIIGFRHVNLYNAFRWLFVRFPLTFLARDIAIDLEHDRH